MVSISFELSDSLSDLEEPSDPEESEPDELSELSSFSDFETVFIVCLWVLSGSGEVERLELLSLSDEDEAAMMAVKLVVRQVR